MEQIFQVVDSKAHQHGVELVGVLVVDDSPMARAS